MHLFGAQPHVAKSPAECAGRSIPIPQAKAWAFLALGPWIPVSLDPRGRDALLAGRLRWLRLSAVGARVGGGAAHSSDGSADR